MKKKLIITEGQIKAIRAALLKEGAAIDNGFYGGVNCTLNFDEDYYEEYLQDNGLQDSPAVKLAYVKDNCDWDIDYLNGETWHTCESGTLNYSEMEDEFGETLAAAILNDCMDEREHSFEFSEYRGDEEVDIHNPQSLNKAAKRVMGVVDSPCGQFRGWILTDGTVLDAGWDHNACFRISSEIKYREDFTKLGNVRFSNVSLEFGKYPTQEQLQQVRQFCEYHAQDIIDVDFLGGRNGRADKRYVGLDFSELSDDLYNYYSRGSLGNEYNSLYENRTPKQPLTLYHGSFSDFDYFDLKYVLTGVGQADYGYGVYLSDNPETAREYSAGHYMYTAEITGNRFLDSEVISPIEVRKIARDFYNYYLQTDYGKEAYAGHEKEFWDMECQYIEKADNGVQVYNTISSILGSDKDASEYLDSRGYVGLRILSDNGITGEKFHNYMIFNPQNIKIVKKEQTDALNENTNLSQYSAKLMNVIERRTGVELSDNGKKWFLGLIGDTKFGITMDMILEKVAFRLLNITPFAVGQSVGNEWDELVGTLKIVMEKTGFGNNILQRIKNLKWNDDRKVISKKEWSVIEDKLRYYPNILNELKRCYYNFAFIAPAIYKTVDYLKKYKEGIPALEFCYLVAYQRERGRAALNVAIDQVLRNTGKYLLPQITAEKLESF